MNRFRSAVRRKYPFIFAKLLAKRLNFWKDAGFKKKSSGYASSLFLTNEIEIKIAIPRFKINNCNVVVVFWTGKRADRATKRKGKKKIKRNGGKNDSIVDCNPNHCRKFLIKVLLIQVVRIRRGADLNFSSEGRGGGHKFTLRWTKKFVRVFYRCNRLFSLREQLLSRMLYTILRNPFKSAPSYTWVIFVWVHVASASASYKRDWDTAS